MISPRLHVSKTSRNCRVFLLQQDRPSAQTTDHKPAECLWDELVETGVEHECFIVVTSENARCYPVIKDWDSLESLKHLVESKHWRTESVLDETGTALTLQCSCKQASSNCSAAMLVACRRYSSYKIAAAITFSASGMYHHHILVSPIYRLDCGEPPQFNLSCNGLIINNKKMSHLLQ